MASTLQPDAQRVLNLTQKSGRPAFDTLTAQKARFIYRHGRAVQQPDPQDIVLVRDLAGSGLAGDIPPRLYCAAGTHTALPTLIYFHGGGWVISDRDTHDTVCRALTNASQGAVVSVDYRPGPEHCLPAAVEDRAAAVRFVAEQAAPISPP